MPRENICTIIYEFVCSFCHQFGPQYDTVDIPEKFSELSLKDCQDTYEFMVQEGNTNEIEELLLYFDDDFDFDHISAFITACKTGQLPVVTWFIKEDLLKSLKTSYNTILNKGLEISVKNNHCDIAEFLVQEGANVMVGLRHSTSVNITRMLYRHKQNTENITA